MTSKSQKVTLKTLKDDIDNLRKELNVNKKHLSDMKKKLNDAEEEIQNLKGCRKISEKSDSVHKCKHCNFTFNTKNALRLHITENHPIKIKCKTCHQDFKLNSDLELHIKENHESLEKYSCELCDKKFVLLWRLQKHQKIHTERKVKKCHYFNNGKPCPYEMIGCMFEHSNSVPCKYGRECNKKLCSYQHNPRCMNVQKAFTDNEDLKCQNCDFVSETETELGKHMDKTHDFWKVRQTFCDRFCRSDHGVHICFSNDDFKEFIGFDVWGTFETDECETVYKCLRCNETDDDADQMRKHIDKKHKNDKASKCNFCDHEDKTWLGLIIHFQTNHMMKT